MTTAFRYVGVVAPRGDQPGARRAHSGPEQVEEVTALGALATGNAYTRHTFVSDYLIYGEAGGGGLGLLAGNRLIDQSLRTPFPAHGL